MRKCYSKEGCGHLAGDSCAFTGECFHQTKHDDRPTGTKDILILLGEGWKTSDKLRATRQYIIDDAVHNQRTMADKEELCPMHKCKTVDSGMLGLWPCPECARDFLGRKPAIKYQNAVRDPSGPQEPPEITEQMDEVLTGNG